LNNFNRKKKYIYIYIYRVKIIDINYFKYKKHILFENRFYWKMRFFTFSIFSLPPFRTQAFPQKNSSILFYLDNSVCRNWNFSCDTERGETEKHAARDMSIARFCYCSSGRGARLLTTGYIEDPPFVTVEKKSTKPLRAQSEYRFAVSRFRAGRCHTRRRGTTQHANAATSRLRPPRVPRHSQFSLNIVISCNVLCQFFPTMPLSSPPRRLASYFCYSTG